MNFPRDKNFQIILSIFISGVCFYLSLSLNGSYGYLFPLAPIPVLLVGFNTPPGKAFTLAFLAYLIGRLSWFSYLRSVVSLTPAVIFTLLLPLAFAILILLSRRVVIRGRRWYSVFAFPVLFTSFEFLVFRFSPDGSAGSIAYSQSNILPLVQIASVTGILGVTFIIVFIPSAIATAFYFRRQRNQFRNIATSFIIIVGAVILYGAARLSRDFGDDKLKVGLAVLAESEHYITGQPDPLKEKRLAEHYATLISTLADHGARVVVLPERAMNLNQATATETLTILANVARDKHVAVITGYTNLNTAVHRNSALAIDSSGTVVVQYNKVHLVRGLENEFTPGSAIGLFTVDKTKIGIAICKDLDFPRYIRSYGKALVHFMAVPAWDFVKDDWLHSRMAVLRGIENGFSEVRTARQGRLTISDPFGRINAEASSADGRAVLLVGEVSLEKKNTIYSRCGDWFGIANVIAAIFFIGIGFTKKRNQGNS